MYWAEFKKHIKKQTANFLEILNDVMLDLPRIVLVGNLQVFIENHRGIDVIIIEGKIKYLELESV